MFKISVMYPNTPGARFDHAYYRDKHMPLVKARMGEHCLSYTVDKGLAGGAPGSPAMMLSSTRLPRPFALRVSSDATRKPYSASALGCTKVSRAPSVSGPA